VLPPLIRSPNSIGFADIVSDFSIAHQTIAFVSPINGNKGPERGAVPKFV